MDCQHRRNRSFRWSPESEDILEFYDGYGLLGIQGPKSRATGGHTRSPAPAWLGWGAKLYELPEFSFL
jgi:hypothetical protein